MLLLWLTPLRTHLTARLARLVLGEDRVGRLRFGALRRVGWGSGGLERLAWFGAGLSAGSAAWLVGEVALGPLGGQASPPGPPPRPTPPPVRVQVDGAVERPGQYDLPPGARVEDAVGAAGGATTAADPSSLNLVARVTDGQRIAVPLRAPPSPPPASVSPASPTPAERPRPRPTRTPTAAARPPPHAATPRATLGP